MLRFSLTTLSALLFTATFALPSVAHAQSKTSDAPTGITERVFGGGGGYPFERTFVKKIAIFGGGYRGNYLCTNVTINDVSHGGSYTERPGALVLDADEYINYVEIAQGWYIDYFKVRTNKGREVAAGNPHANKTILENIRVLRIGGRCAETLDQLQIEYIQNYRPSKLVEKRAVFLLDAIEGPRKIKTWRETTQVSRQAAKRVTTLMAAAKLSSTVEAEYFAKVSATFELETKTTKMSSVSTALEKTIKQGQESELTIPLGHVAVLVNVGQVLQHGDKSWIVPGASSTWLIIDRSKVEDCQRLVGAYDLHGAVLMKQVPGLETETHLDYPRITVTNADRAERSVEVTGG